MGSIQCFCFCPASCFSKSFSRFSSVRLFLCFFLQVCVLGFLQYFSSVCFALVFKCVFLVVFSVLIDGYLCVSCFCVISFKVSSFRRLFLRAF